MSAGTVFTELDLDFSKFEKNQQKLLSSAKEASTSVEKNWQNLGVKSDNIFNAMRASAENSFNMIKNKAGTSTAEIARAHEAMNAKIAAANKEQYGSSILSIDNLKSHWIAASAIIATAGIAASKAWDMAKAGAEFDEQRSILDNLGQKYDTTADQIVEAMDRASDNQIAKSELMRIALAGLAKGLNPQQLIDLADAAEILGDSVGVSAKTALEDLTQALETGRVKGLKTYLGTSLDLKEAFGDLESKMTAVEKSQAMYNMTMIASADLQAQQTKAIDGGADSIARVEKKFDDATLAASRFMKSLVVSVIDAPAKFSAMSANVDLLTGELIQAGEATKGLGAGVAADPVTKIKEQYQAQIDGLKKVLSAREDNKKSIKDTETATKKAVEELKKLEDESTAALIQGAEDSIAVIAKMNADDVASNKKMYEETDKLQEKSMQDWFKAIDDKKDADIKAGQAKIARTEKNASDRLAAERDVYKDLRGYDNQYYEASTALINKQAETYRKLGISEVAIDAWTKEEHYKTDRAKALSTQNFFSGVKVGLEDLERRNTKFAQAGEATMAAFAKNAEKQLSDNFFNLLKGNIDEVGIDWSSMWDSMLRTATDYMARIAVETAVNYGAKAAVKGAEWLFDVFMGYGEGAWEVAQDKLTKVHKGEMIIPAEQAEQIRAESGPSGTEAWGKSAPSMDLSFAAEYGINAAAKSFMSAYGWDVIGKELASIALAGKLTAPVLSLAMTLADLAKAGYTGYQAYAAMKSALSQDTLADYGAFMDPEGMFSTTGIMGPTGMSEGDASAADAASADSEGPGSTSGGGNTGGAGTSGGTAGGGDSSGDNSWARGGIPTGPDTGYWARLHGTEAVVPLPNGRSIPVEMKSVRGGSSELVEEIKALRDELRQANYQIAKNTGKTAKVLDRWDGDGQPEIRTV